MNSSRLVASVGGYFVSASDDAVAFHLYGGISTTVALKSGKVFLRETSTYPWSGSIRIEVSPETRSTFEVRLRIPGWADGATATVNGQVVDVKAGVTRGYLRLERQWNTGDVIELDLPMPPERIYAHPSVKENVGRVALKRGPLIYCVEETDNPGGKVQQLELPRDAKVGTAERMDIFDGTVTLTAAAERLLVDQWEGLLYRSQPPSTSTVTLTALPYFLWNNREGGSMQVWIAETVK